MVFGSGGRERPAVLQPGLSAGRASSHNILRHLVLHHLLPADTGAFLFGIGLCSGECPLSKQFFGEVRSLRCPCDLTCSVQPPSPCQHRAETSNIDRHNGLRSAQGSMERCGGPRWPQTQLEYLPKLSHGSCLDSRGNPSYCPHIASTSEHGYRKLLGW